jgi:nucleoside 2-deoxyribosyltransferase
MSSGRCCVFQPFDEGGPFDRRFAETLTPAIEAADLEPYRVDRDLGAVILMETLHEEIKSSKICVADISKLNPNVMYELGFAIASRKDVVMICQKSDSVPFNIRHRTVIYYSAESKSDLDHLEKQVRETIKTLIEKQERTLEIKETLATITVANSQGLLPNEYTALALIMSDDFNVTSYDLNRQMSENGFTALATRLAVAKLVRYQMIEVSEKEDQEYDRRYFIYRVLASGEDWVSENRDKFALRNWHRAKGTNGVLADPASLAFFGDDEPF